MSAMGMSMRHRLSMRHSLRHEQRLRQRALLRLGHAGYALRLTLIDTLSGAQYLPDGQCPKCRYDLTPLEILKGFNTDPDDLTTCYPQCKARFSPQLKSFVGGGYVELVYFCPAQVLDRLPSLAVFAPAELRKTRPSEYHSAVVHFGSLCNAFKQIGIDDYPEEKIPEWARKVKPFFGRLPDTVIAECAGQSVRVVSALRHEAGIRAYNRRHG